MEKGGVQSVRVDEARRGWRLGGVGGDEKQETQREHTHTTPPPTTRRRSFSVFYRAETRGEGAKPNSMSSPESGASIGPDPSRGPPAWAGNRLTLFLARPPQAVNTPRSDPMT